MITISGSRWSLQAARDWFRHNLKPGGDEVICPCCDRSAKVRKRSLNSGMAVMLIRWYRAWKRGDDWLHYSEGAVPGRTGLDYSMLRFWGFLEPKTRRDRTDNSSGLWRITPRGIAFVERRLLTVPRHIYTYDDARLCFGIERTTIDDALGDRFDYAELMAS